MNVIPTSPKINENVAYLIGVLNSDGYLGLFLDKKRNLKIYRLKIDVAGKSLPMIKKFEVIFNETFERNVHVYDNQRWNRYEFGTSINRLRSFFKPLENGGIYPIMRFNPKLFGAYLAGIIDGDGHVQKKNNKDRKIPQMRIEICGPNPLLEIKEGIEHLTRSKVNFIKNKGENSYDTYFYVTGRNRYFLENFVIPHLALDYKKENLQKYLDLIK